MIATHDPLVVKINTLVVQMNLVGFELQVIYSDPLYQSQYIPIHHQLCDKMVSGTVTQEDVCSMSRSALKILTRHSLIFQGALVHPFETIRSCVNNIQEAGIATRADLLDEYTASVQFAQTLLKHGALRPAHVKAVAQNARLLIFGE